MGILSSPLPLGHPSVIIGTDPFKKERPLIHRHDMSIACPACQTSLEPGAGSCPVCLRPRPRSEIFRTLRQAQRDLSQRRRRPQILLLSALAIGALAYGIRHLPPGALERLKAALIPKEEHQRVILDEHGIPQEQPLPALPARRGWRRPGAGTAHAPHAHADTRFLPGDGQTFPDAPRRAPARSPAPKQTLARPAAGESAFWTLRGAVYDLMDLRRVQGARIIFRNKISGKEFPVKSDSNGIYRAMLPRLRDGGYEISVRRQDYRPDFLEEMQPPYKSQSRARREEAASLMRTTRMLHVPLLPDASKRELRYDLILCPLP